MASLQPHPTLSCFLHSITFDSSKLSHIRTSISSPLSKNFLFSGKVRVLTSNFRYSLHCLCKGSAEIEKVSAREEIDRPPFDINRAVILAGFAFEAYTSPPDNVGKLEVDAANCKTVYLSESFLHEIYDGQLFIKLKNGFNFPAMDPWGTSDPYVVMQLDGQVVKSKVKWGTKEPTWNEEFALNIKQYPTKTLQVAAWDANLVTPHKRMGNASINLESFSDGITHEVLVDLEGIGGGGKIQLEVKYKSFDEIDEEMKCWRIPIVTEFLRKNGFEPALKKIVGSETVQARQFVEYAFGQIKSLNDAYLQKDWFSKDDKYEKEDTNNFSDSISESDIPPPYIENSSQRSSNDMSSNEDSKLLELQPDYSDGRNKHNLPTVNQDKDNSQSDKQFWNNFSDVINQNVVQKLGIPALNKNKWDGFDLLNTIGLQSRRIAEAGYIQSGLASPKESDVVNDDAMTDPVNSGNIQSSLPDIKRVTQDLLRQTDSILGGLMVLNTAVSELNKEGSLLGWGQTETVKSVKVENDISEDSNNKMSGSVIDEKRAEEMKALFSTAETAMEAWAMLATSCGHSSFIKSEFEKLCFLDNESTDTQVAIWRDSARKRLVVAFRGTEQDRWKDLLTDIMMVPAGLNPERIGGDFKQEVQVHSGFLSAFDSVRIRIISLIKLAIGDIGEAAEPLSKWHVYVTGHSLGGALATLLALELSSSQLSKQGAISVSMYNFGSPRVGNKKFAEVYNEKVKDSWRVVNHRDIIPTVPRLMGYCHVAQPVYLAAGDVNNAMDNMELLEDGYQGDVLGESTPDVLVNEVMKGEKELIEKILNTEINIFLSIRDGSALMQHMEDFYYISLLENVRSNYKTIPNITK